MTQVVGKPELIRRIRENAGITQSAARNAVDNVVEGVANTVGQGDGRICRRDLGTFALEDPAKQRLALRPSVAAERRNIQRNEELRFRRAWPGHLDRRSVGVPHGGRPSAARPRSTSARRSSASRRRRNRSNQGLRRLPQLSIPLASRDGRSTQRPRRRRMAVHGGGGSCRAPSPSPCSGFALWPAIDHLDVAKELPRQSPLRVMLGRFRCDGTCGHRQPTVCSAVPHPRGLPAVARRHR